MEYPDEPETYFQQILDHLTMYINLIRAIKSFLALGLVQCGGQIKYYMLLLLLAVK